jgi:hypothetical protein
MASQSLNESGYRLVRAWIIFAMFTCVAAIFVGLLIPGNLTQTKIVISTAMFLVAFFSHYPLTFIYPNGQVNPKVCSNACLTVLLIWLLLPISAAMNAWGFAIGVYDPIRDDAYPHSLGHWWILIVSQIVIGIAITTIYLRKSVMLVNNAWSPSYFWASWGLQLFTALAFRFGPTW